MSESVQITPCPYPFCRFVGFTQLSLEVKLMDEYDRRQIEKRCHKSASAKLEKAHDRGYHKKQNKEANQ